MRLLIKKISLLLLVVSLGWFPVQVTFATSFIMSNAQSTGVKAKNNNVQNNNTRSNHANRRHNISQANFESKSAFPAISKIEKSKSHCAMHEKGKDCCADKSDCGGMDQDCGHCFNFAAMLHEQSQANFQAIYIAQSSSAYTLSGIISISAYRPPRI